MPKGESEDSKRESLEEALKSRQISPEEFQKLLEALQNVPYLENVKVADDSIEFPESKGMIAIEGNYVIDSKKMPQALYPGMLELKGTTSREIDMLRSARRLFSAIGNAIGYEFEFDDISADTDLRVMSATVKVKKDVSGGGLYEKIWVCLDEKGD